MVKQLSGGLILRSLGEGTPQDKANLPQFYVDTFTEAYGSEDAILGKWTNDLVSGQHPVITDDDIWVVVDPAYEERIVAALLLLPQTWRYETVEFGVGRVELVATNKDYRNRGLIRELFHALHTRSEALGHNVQSITGIPHFYRQFGYAMAVDLGGSGMIPFVALPELKEGESAKYNLRPATVDDIPKLMKWECHYAKNRLLSVARPPEYWKYDLTTRNPKSNAARRYFIITQQESDKEVGYIGTAAIAWGIRFGCVEYVVDENASYLDTFDDVVRGIYAYVKENFTEKPPSLLTFDSGLYATLRPFLERNYHSNPRPTNYAWYMRIVDLPRFMWGIQPVLEQRLEGSSAHRFTGQIHISFYAKKGLFMRFENGKLVEVNDSVPALDKEDAAFPYHTFLNLVFGHRTLDELTATYPDAFANTKAYVILSTLFPRKPSWLMAIA